MDTNYKPYYDKRDELSFEYGILMRAGRIFTPSKLRRDVLKAIHAGYAGIVGSKSLSRTYVWWLGINGDLEQYVHTCQACQQNRRCEPEHPIMNWSIPNSRCRRAYTNFAGQVDGEMYLVMVCAMTKWPEVLKVSSTNTQSVIKQCESFCETRFTRGVSR
ncbi:hypothetical protein GJ496_009627 [Pomphorhynchus laevis]|nr:hypothetical protein GJ496_009627 [Pomphorhynchus laevis]